MNNMHIGSEKFIERFCDERYLERFSDAIKAMYCISDHQTSADKTRAMSYKSDSAPQYVSLNDTEEVSR